MIDSVTYNVDNYRYEPNELLEKIYRQVDAGLINSLIWQGFLKVYFESISSFFGIGYYIFLFLIKFFISLFGK